jgi:soluble lytic murein transglycosylase-like protein
MEHCGIISVLFGLTCLVTVWPSHAGAEPTAQQASTRCSGTSTLCELVSKEAERVGIDPALVDAVIKVESDYQPEAIGASGEIGLMQVLPSTAKLLDSQATKRN